MNKKNGDNRNWPWSGGVMVLAFGTARLRDSIKIPYELLRRVCLAQPAQATNPHSSPMTPIKEVAREVERARAHQT